MRCIGGISFLVSCVVMAACSVQPHPEPPLRGGGPGADADLDGDDDAPELDGGAGEDRDAGGGPDADADVDGDSDGDTDVDPEGDCDGDVPDCEDLDGDGYGDGAGCEGLDCDDSNPSVWLELDCEVLCDADPHSTGCPCALEEPELCYLGPEGTLGVGECRRGVRGCIDGMWSACWRQGLPSCEVCEGEADEDCDGAVDEDC